MRQRFFVLFILLLCFPPSSAFAARVFGDIKINGKPIPAGVPVKIFRPMPAGGKSTAAPSIADSTTTDRFASYKLADSTATDKFGSYKLMVKEEGKCALAILYEKQTISIDIFSYKEATRYDLIFEKTDGKLSLRRK